MTANLKCSVKLFADNPSLFTIVQDPVMAASDMNQDLNQTVLWARNWRMSFNPNAQKQAVELFVFKEKTEK